MPNSSIRAEVAASPFPYPPARRSAPAEEGGGYYVTVPALPGVFTRGSTLEECRERATEAIEVHIAGLQADGEPIPEEVGSPQLMAITVAA